ncbi:small multi-drug export protein [Ihubacter massiliensis]|uniref:Small multi-drug export protein n=1 Tax=Hominibacterium faecale TaxID=2839743 RepID=A0A9J6QQ90_9FIRM|nr:MULTISPECIES: small multi-drug export protein [Eubacteriales Family XIII. Incertae Sedis]MCO7121859.1 small multi-drug export protein [Ihubacter massiliensis]MCU7377596.1 small multi-drug export protein [Hominibacterium faecale]
MHLLFKTITVTGIAVLELWAAIPAGFVFGLPPIIIAIVTIIGGILSSLLVVTIGGHVKNYIQNRRAAKYQQLSTSEQIEMQQRESKKKHRQHSKIYQVWDKYGIIGLGLLAPVLTGALIGSTIAVSLGVPKQRIILWVSLGVIMWTVLLVTLAALGIDFIFR